jgi:hypothetical protein
MRKLGKMEGQFHLVGWFWMQPCDARMVYEAFSNVSPLNGHWRIDHPSRAHYIARGDTGGQLREKLS